MRNGYPIRSNLGSEHVKPARARRQLEQAQFGIYRPLSDDCLEMLAHTLENIETDVTEYLDGKPGQPAVFKSQKDLGVTFLEQRDVRKALKRRHIDLHGIRRVMHDVDNQNYDREGEDELEVPLSGFSWFGSGDRKLAGQIDVRDASDGWVVYDDTEPAAQLVYETQQIGDTLRDIGASALAENVRVPDHVSLFSYRSPMPGYVQTEHKKVIGDIVYDNFSRDNITSIALADVVVGSSYSKSLQLVA